MDKINLGVIGAGSWGPNLIRNFNSVQGCNIKYVVDSDEKAREKIKSLYPDIDVKEDIEEILNDDELKAVVISTSAPTHYKLAKAAIEAGKDIYVEKPITLKADQARELIKISKDKDLIIMVGHLLLYHTGINYLKDIIKRGDLGDIYYLYTSRVNLGKVRNKENAFWSFAPHDISIILHLIEEMPIRISSTGAAFLNPKVEDVVFSTMEFSSGKVAHMHVSWLDPHKIRKTTVVGSKKMAVFDDAAPTENLRIYDKGVDYKPGMTDYNQSLTLRIGDIHIPKIPSGEPLKIECNHFVECIKKRLKPISDGINGLNVVKILEAGSLSLHNNGMPVEIPKD